MNKSDLARRLAKQSHRSAAKAADDVDTLVYRILKELKTSDQNRDHLGPIRPTAPAPRPPRES